MPSHIAGRAFAWDDVPDVHALISVAWGERGARSYLHIGDFYWSLRPSERFDPRRDLRLWELGGELYAFAWFDGPASGEIVVRPGAPKDLQSNAIDWLETEHRQSSSTAPFTIAAIDDDIERTSLLADRGYARGNDGGVRFHRPVDAPPTPTPLPDGFTVRSLSSGDDVARRVFVQRTSFERSSATVENWQSMMVLSGYRDELDLIIIAPTGEGAAACTCWYDEANRCGEFEPVGTSRSYWRMGLGKAVVTEGLRRLRALGATQAIVQTNSTNEAAIALYRSCGFELAATQHDWTKQP